jgi:hypothetical protein
MTDRPQKRKAGSRQPKDQLLQLRVGALEKQGFEDAAAVTGLGLSAWVRERLRRAAIKDLEEAGRPVAFLPPIDED